MRNKLLLISALAALMAQPVQAQSVKVTINYDLQDSAGNTATIDGENNVPLLINQDGLAYGISYTAGQASSRTIPAGTYDLYGTFMFPDEMKAKTHAHQAIVVREGINITKDTTLTLSLKDAKNHIGVTFYLPDGRKFQNTTTETTTGETLTESMAATANSSFALRHRTAGTLVGDVVWGVDANAYTNGVLSTYAGPDLLLSDMSDKYALEIEGSFNINKDDGTRYATGIGLGFAGCSKSVNLVNDPKHFVTITDSYRKTPLGENSSYHGFGGDIKTVAEAGDYFVSIDGSGASTSYPGKDESKVVNATYYMCDEMQAQGPNFMKLLGKTELNDYRNPKNKNYFNMSPWQEVKDGKLYCQVTGTKYLSYYKYNGVRYTSITPHPAYSYFKDQMGGNVLCNNVPVLNIATAISSSTKKMYRVYPIFVGRYGEERGTDQWAAKYTVAVGDSVLKQGNIGNIFINLTSEGKLVSGKLNITVADSNCVVDDMPAQNISTMSMDMSKTERNLPTVTMLQFRNKADGTVTEHFDTNSADDEILLSAGSFDYNLSTKVYDQEACKVEVSYSPSGKNDWKPLLVTEDPALKRVEFGNFYRGDLSQVTEKSDNKWYDLKVVVTAKNGNYQQQLIEPAFRIEKIEGTGVNDVETAKAVQSVRYYDLTGRQSAEPTEGINIKVITYTDGTTRSEKVMK